MKKLLLILLCSFIFFACQKEQQKTIILSKASSNYVKWIEDENSGSFSPLSSSINFKYLLILYASPFVEKE